MLLDNKANGKVIDELRKKTNDGSKLSVLSAVFSIYGFSALRKELSKIDSMRLLLGDPEAPSLDYLTGAPDDTPLKANLDLQRIAAECAAWVDKKASVRKLKGPALPQNIFHISDPQGSSCAVTGTASLSAASMGAIPSTKLAMNQVMTDPESTRQLLEWFDNVWNDLGAAEDIKRSLLDKLNYLASDRPAALSYFFTLFNLFQDFVEDLDEDSIIRSQTGFKETVVWNKLYKFQKDGVLGAIDKLERYNGCIIADSVGLGKTFEALAVIKYYELRNDRVLVLAPKKLRENWTVYTINDKRNLLAADRFGYDVLNHTDLSRDKGRSGEINLETLNWGNYDLIVIDESHNFRNNNAKKEGVTRYQRLMEDVIKSGVKTKVLMLSATPVNNRLNDLKNQVSFITEGVDSAFDAQGVTSVDLTLRRAQTQFNAWVNLPEENRTTERLLDSLHFGYFRLLDLLTIARSRKHIEKYYDTAEIGKFPERLQPKNIKADIDKENQFPPLKEINRNIKLLSLAAYAPLNYVLENKKEEYSRKYDQQVRGGKGVLKQADREKSLIHLMRVNLLKRMESSIHSFALTVEKLHSAVGILLEKIEKHQMSEVEELSIEDIETDSPELDDMMIGRKIKVLIQDMDLIRLKQDLTADHLLLGFLLREAQKVGSPDDAKLQALKDAIARKIRTPINEGNRKVIVFTAFSDTAEYLYKNINEWAQGTFGLNSALITGTGKNKTTMKGVKAELNALLTNFSPISKERSKIDPTASDEVDILVATDCISEGQNLQDCDMLVNYDIHWNPVRIIQRFGRVDRLGSKNDAIQLTNFWPNMELDEYINLEARVSGRMVLLDISATGEENVIEYDESKQMRDMEYRRKQMKQLQETVIDLEDMDGNISITDMNLNDFRMDLSSFMKDNLEELEAMPTGLRAVVSPTLSDMPTGCIFCLKDLKGNVQNDESYALAPHYLVFVSDTGEIVYNHVQAKKSLDIYKKLGATASIVAPEAVDRFNSATQSGKDMSHYRTLLDKAIESIIGKTEEKGVESLFSRGGTTITKDHLKGGNDFEVVSFLIIKASE